jgi:hypothetical protein
MGKLAEYKIWHSWGSILFSPFTKLTCRVTKTSSSSLPLLFQRVLNLIPFPEWYDESRCCCCWPRFSARRSTSSFFLSLSFSLIFFFRKFLSFYPILVSLCFHQTPLSPTSIRCIIIQRLSFLLPKRTVGTCPNG